MIKAMIASLVLSQVSAQPTSVSSEGQDLVIRGIPGDIVVVWADARAIEYANCDGSTDSPTLNVQDFQCFANAFASGDPWANCDGSTTDPVLTIQDFSCFLNAFASGESRLQSYVDGIDTTPSMTNVNPWLPTFTWIVDLPAPVMASVGVLKGYWVGVTPTEQDRKFHPTMYHCIVWPDQGVVSLRFRGTAMIRYTSQTQDAESGGWLRDSATLTVRGSMACTTARLPVQASLALRVGQLAQDAATALPTPNRPERPEPKPTRPWDQDPASSKGRKDRGRNGNR